MTLASTGTRQVVARALLLGDRIDASGLERADMVSANPLAFRAGAAGLVVLYRFGVAVAIGLSPLEEEEVVKLVKARLFGPHAHIDDETALIAVAADDEDRISPGAAISLRDLSAARLLVVADALAKSVSLGRDEREVNTVFDVVEPFALRLADAGRAPRKRRSMLKLIGQTLLVQHRLSGRIAIEEKPDVLWDRPDLERLYARLEDEYELAERAQTLKRKLDVISETARAVTDIIEANRATRLETIVVVLILLEVFLTIAQIVLVRH